MKRWWADTLFKRLFVLMWFGLVGSHLLAFYVTTRVEAPPGGAAPDIRRLPVLPSLPPMGAPQAQPGGSGAPPGPPPGMALFDRPAPPAGPLGDAGGGPGAAPPPGQAPPDQPGSAPGGLPADALWLDYGIRFLAIGAVAWFGARWLSMPMRRLAEASEGLGRALGRGPQAGQLDEHRGTLEVRRTAQVFNAMAQRLRAQFDAQGLLMAAISHDLRTPLTRLRLRLEAMQAQPQSERCIADVREMDALIGSVLEMMRDQHAPAERARVDVAALVQSLVDDLAEQGQPASASCPPAGQPAVVLAQPAALNRMLGNLIGNAVRYGGSAEVSVGVQSGQVRVVVDDRGPGIAPQHLDAVFQPFYRVDGSRTRGDGGTGLGLYIARDLAQRNGGHLTLANRGEGGLRAELVLPAA